MTATQTTLLPAPRVEALKTPYATRRVPREAFATLLTDAKPAVGDLVLARVKALGQHKHLELASGRRAKLFPGDEIVLAYGNRYAPDQFEAEIPEDLGPCHMVAGGGIASRMIDKHARMSGATEIEPVGLIGDRSGRVINLADYALPKLQPAKFRPFTVAVVGTSMNAGKTDTVTHTIRGLREAGYRVGAAKVTGTGSGGDAWSMVDAGAFEVLDFSDAGLPSTYLASIEQCENVTTTLVAELTKNGAQTIVFEVADGLFQRETAQLLESPVFRSQVDAVIFAAGDAMGAAAGVSWLRARNLPVVAASGLMTASPLAAREAADAAGIAILTREDLASATLADRLGVGESFRAAISAAG
ncbi:MAG TPA: DUF1611 domain-containing protein [Rhodocyclaceae bacterium]